jgi:hypothetical protein
VGKLRCDKQVCKQNAQTHKRLNVVISALSFNS